MSDIVNGGNVPRILDDLNRFIAEDDEASSGEETVININIANIKDLQINEGERTEEIPLYSRNYKAHKGYLSKLYSHYGAKGIEPEKVQKILDTLVDGTHGLVPHYYLPVTFNGLDWLWITELATEFKCPPHDVFNAACALSRLVERRHNFLPQLVQKMTWQAAAVNRLSNNILTKLNEWAVAYPSIDRTLQVTNSSKKLKLATEIEDQEWEPRQYDELVKLTKKSEVVECILPQESAKWLISKIKSMDSSEEKAFIKDICFNLKIAYINSPDGGNEKIIDEVLYRFTQFMEIISQYERISESIEDRLLELETSANITLSRIRRILK